MSLNPETEARILRLFHAEKWRPNTIARQLRVHHSAVARVLAQAGLAPAEAAARASMVDAYVPLVRETLERFPTLTAARLYAMARERGYRGSASHFRYRVSLLRPRKAPEAYLRLRTLPGEQAQMDWGHFGHLQVGRARRPLVAFVMVLSYSRAIYLRFFPEARMASFLAGHVQAFEAFGGVPRVILYDNLKSAVLGRAGDAIRFNPALLALAAHYRFEPRPVAVCRGRPEAGSNVTTRNWFFLLVFFCGRYPIWISLRSLFCSSVFFWNRVVAGAVTWRETRHGEKGEAQVPELRRDVYAGAA